MKLLQEKKIKINETEYPLRKNARCYLTFEEMTGHSIDLYQNTTKDGLSFFYACLIGGGLRISFEEFLDLLNEENIDILISEFVKTMNETVTEEKKPKAR